MAKMGKKARGVDPRRHDWTLLDATLADWWTGANSEAKAALQHCPKHLRRIPVLEDESDGIAYFTRLDLPSAQVPPMTDTLRAVVGATWPATSHAQLRQAAGTFRDLGPDAWRLYLDVTRSLRRSRPRRNDLREWPSDELMILNTRTHGPSPCTDPPAIGIPRCSAR